MIVRDVIFETELVKQSPLIDLPLTHHRLHPRKDRSNESAIESEGNKRVFQHNQAKADIRTEFTVVESPPCQIATLRSRRGPGDVLFSEEVKQNFSLARHCAMLEQEYTLPTAKHQLAAANWNAELRLGQRALYVGRHVVRALSGV